MLSTILGVFTEVAEWFATIFEEITPIFYNTTDSALTFMGVLGVAGLAISIILLVIGIVQRFLKFGA